VYGSIMNHQVDGGGPVRNNQGSIGANGQNAADFINVGFNVAVAPADTAIIVSTESDL
jgi:hypothetical protein